MTPEDRQRVYRVAQKIAEVMGPEFTGQVVVHVHRGDAGSVDVREILRRGTIRRQEMDARRLT